MTPPPPAEQLSTRIFLGPALRTQSDRRLVKLVREGYETAFEEIVRRYRRPLDRFAAAFVGGRSEDVTQDAFSKALLALRGSEAEIELRPWLYRIVRNTALNDLRDRPPSAEQLGETLSGARSAATEVERREEMTELVERLQALPEPQRAAIVMRELEGLSHDEIAAALGISGGGARQQIYRARIALRNGLGMLLPLPLLRLLFDHGAEAAAGADGAAAAAGAASAGGGAALGGIGAAGALKVGVATVVLAGSVGAGVAVQNDRGAQPSPATTAAQAAFTPGGGSANGGSSGSGSGSTVGGGDDSGRDGSGRGPRGHGGPGPGESGGGRGSEHSGSGEDSGGGSHSGRGSGGDSGSGRGGPEDGGGHGDSGSGSGRSGSGGGNSSGKSGSDSGGRGSSGSGGHGGGSGSSGSGSGGSSGSAGSGGSEPDSGRDGSGSSGGPEPVPPPEQPPSESSGSGSGGSGSGGSGSGSGDDRADDGS